MCAYVRVVQSVGAGLQSVGIGSDQSQLTVGAKQKKGRFQVSQVVDTSMGGGMVASSSQPGLATEGSVTTPPAAAAGATTTTSAADGGADIASTSNAAGASSRLHVLTAAGGSSYGLAAEGGAAPDINIGLPPLAPATTSALAHGDGTTATGSGGGAAPEDGKEAKKEQRGRFKVNVLEGNVGAPLPEPVSRSMSGMHRISSGAALPTSGLGSATTSSTGMKVDTDTAAMSISGLYGGVTSPHGSDAGYMAMPTTPHGAGSGPGGLPPLPPQAPPPLVLPLQQQGQAAAPVPAPAGAGPSAAPAASSPAAVQNVLPSVISCLVGLIEQTSSHQEALQGLMMTVVQAVGTVKPLPIPEEHLAHLRQQIANNQKDRRELDRQLLTLSNIVHNQYHR